MKAVMERGTWKSGEAPVTHGTDKESVSVVNCDVDTSEAAGVKLPKRDLDTLYLYRSASVYPSIQIVGG